MSKIGKQPIQIPTAVEVTIEGRDVSISGPKTVVTHTLPRELKLQRENDMLLVLKDSPARYVQALWGLWRALLANDIQGAHAGFEKRLELTGVGYRVNMKGKDLELMLGFSHPILFKAPEDITLSIDDKYIVVSGPSKQRVGQIAAEIRKLRAPEPYKGKGIKYVGEIIRRKAGKAAKAG